MKNCNEKINLKSNKTKSRNFTDLIPHDWPKNLNVEELICTEFVDLVVNLSQRVTPKADMTTDYKNLMKYPGVELVDPVFLKLATNLALLCRELADGKNKKTIHAYLTYRLFDAGYSTLCLGRDLLAVVAGTVRKDYIVASSRPIVRRQ
jgi:hypothetical protein